MQVNPEQHHFAHAAVRHYKDAVFLTDGARLPNADHSLVSAVLCGRRGAVAPWWRAGQPVRVAVAVRR
ncbi:hypothetical protein [Streptomyces sp. NPDC056405]|uniref:hypothetical protein n=1 Tax=Streptomyces sp. NPDC056405 TaxID=3345811 RepID=UPI0035DF3AF0